MSKESINDIFHNYIKSGYLGKHEMLLNIDNYNLLVKFFNQTIKTSKTCFFPSNFENDFNFIGKKEFTNDDIEKLWCRLEEKPLFGKRIKLSSLFFWCLNNKKIMSLINYDIETNKINFITDNNIVYEEYYITENIYKTIYNIIVNKIIFYKNFNSFDQIQISNFRFNDSFNISEILTKDFEYFLDCEYKILESGYFNEKNSKIYYKYSEIYSLLFLYITNKSLEKCTNWICIYLKKNIFDSKINFKIFPLCYNTIIINDIYKNSLEYLFMEIKNNFEIISKSYEFNKKTITNKKKYNSNYKILPDNFFHLHCTNPLDEKNDNSRFVLLTAHAKFEIVNSPLDSSIDIDYKFIDIKNNQHDITRFCQNSQNVFLDRIYHNFYILFDLKTNCHNIFFIKNPNILKFWSLNESVGIEETLGGINYMDINYIENYSVIISKCNKKCTFFCNCK